MGLDNHLSSIKSGDPLAALGGLDGDDVDEEEEQQEGAEGAGAAAAAADERYDDSTHRPTVR